jgi:uncharacterized protein (DUF2249 family)
MKALIILLGIFLNTCNSNEIVPEVNHYHLTVLPLPSEINSIIKIKIAKCSELVGNWQIIADGQIVVNRHTLKTRFPFEYNWQTTTKGQHIISVISVDEQGNQQGQSLIIYN